MGLWPCLGLTQTTASPLSLMATCTNFRMPPTLTESMRRAHLLIVRVRALRAFLPTVWKFLPQSPPHATLKTRIVIPRNHNIPGAARTNNPGVESARVTSKAVAFHEAVPFQPPVIITPA